MKLTELQEAWLQALESGQYQQGRNILSNWADADGSYQQFCCMGVGCDVLMKRGLLSDEGHSLNLAYPTDEAVNLLGWIRTDGRLDLKHEEAKEIGTVRLSFLNDAEHKTFPEIAAEVRAHPDLYFVEAGTREMPCS